MSLEDAFLQDILEHPDDDVPRLVYADWLSERGDPRGEFIRAQVELARMAEDDPRRDELEDCEAELERRWGEEWARPLAGRAKQWQFRRGFLDAVWVTAEQLEARDGNLFRVALVNAVNLDWIGPPGGVLFHPRMGLVTSLRIHFEHIGDGVARALAESPWLANLVALNLSHNDIGDEGARAIAFSPHLAGLTSLELSFNRGITDRGAEALAASPHLGRLRSLDVGFCSLTPDGAWALGMSPALASLRSFGLGGVGGRDAGLRVLLSTAPSPDRFEALSLEGCGITAEGAGFLAGCEYLTGLRRLRLGRNVIGDEGARALAASRLTGLEELELDDSGLTAAGVRSLTGAPFFPRLRSLHLAGNPLGEAGARVLRQEPAGRLVELLLYEARLGDDGAGALAAAPLLGRVTFLQLASNDIGPEGTKALAVSPHLGRLRRLRLEGNPLGDAGAEALAAWPRLGHLDWLCLEDCGIGDRGALALASSPHAEGLRSLSLKHNRLGDGGRDALRRRFGKRVEL